MTDREALEATEIMIDKILIACNEYAVKDGLPLRIVIQGVCKTLMEIIDATQQDT